MLEFAAWGYTNFPPTIGDYQGPPVSFSYHWNQTFTLPAAPSGDYYEVTRINTGMDVDGAIVIDGQPFYGVGQVLDFSPAPDPDPDYTWRIHTSTRRNGWI